MAQQQRTKKPTIGVRADRPGSKEGRASANRREKQRVRSDVDRTGHSAWQDASEALASPDAHTIERSLIGRRHEETRTDDWTACGRT